MRDVIRYKNFNDQVADIGGYRLFVACPDEDTNAFIRKFTIIDLEYLHRYSNNWKKACMVAAKERERFSYVFFQHFEKYLNTQWNTEEHKHKWLIECRDHLFVIVIFDEQLFSMFEQYFREELMTFKLKYISNHG